MAKQEWFLKTYFYLQTKIKITMELITMLAEKHLEKQSVSKILQMCGFEKLEAYTKPFMEMQNEDAIQAVLKWIACNSANGQSYEIRMRVAKMETTYGLKPANRSGSIYVTRMWEVAKAKENELHCWLPDVSYRTLSVDEIQRSINELRQLAK